MRLRKLLLALSLALLCVPLPAAAQPTGLEPGNRPPQFEAEDMQGQAQSLSKHAGKWVVLQFWATWCPFCQAEIPKLKAIQEKYGDVTVLAVSVDESFEDLRDYLRANSLPYTVVSDALNDFEISRSFRVIALPTTYVIDPQGRIAEVIHGVTDLDARAEGLFSEAEGDGAL